ncbi:MAG: substrate-binding domain-containing protein [Streptosporangiaceae bacterium]
MPAAGRTRCRSRWPVWSATTCEVSFRARSRADGGRPNPPWSRRGRFLGWSAAVGGEAATRVPDALREGGRRIPDDIALVGYDNWDVFAPGRPPLTTVDMRLKNLGKHAARNCSRSSPASRLAGASSSRASW